MLLPALILAALCTPDATYTPTPTVRWDASAPGGAGVPIAGYSIYYREPGGVFSRLVDLPCEWYDSDADDVLDAQSCRGVSFAAPLQRYCATCVPLTQYEIAVQAYDLMGTRSAYSNTISVCLPQICAIRSGPCL